MTLEANNQRITGEGQQSPDRPPSILYTFFAFNEWTQNIFQKNQIYFQSPDCFNDPFDTKPVYIYEGTEEQRILRVMSVFDKEAAKDLVSKGKDIKHILIEGIQSAERCRKQYGIFCMTETKIEQNLLMWSHYSDSHKGFCLGFDTNNKFFGDRAWKIKDGTHYRKNRRQLNLIDTSYKDEIVDSLLTKHEAWKYEEEWRIIDHQHGPGIQTFPAESLVKVILGCKISPENRNKIMNWCRARNPMPRVFWAEENYSKFKLDLKLDFCKVENLKAKWAL